MTRTAARELAVLICASMSPGDAPEEVVSRFFEPEHYASLAPEGAQFAERPDEKQMDYIRGVAALTGEHRAELDACIAQYAHGWKTERLSRITAAILRCAMAEILYLEDVPAGAAINEAVELTKKYEDPDAPAFVNGVLGGFVRGEHLAEE